MPKVSPIQSNFGGGEYSPKVYGRVEADRYKSGMAVTQNYIPAVQGGLARRSGSIFMTEITGTAGEYQARLIPFKFSQTQSYVIEVGFGYFRFYKDRALITLTAQAITNVQTTGGTPVAYLTVAAHGYSTNDYVVVAGVGGQTQLNNRQFIVEVIDANNFRLRDLDSVYVDNTLYDAYTSGGTVAKVYEVANTYTSSQVFDIKHTQSVDVLYLTHPSHPQRKLTRSGHTSWTLTDIAFLDGPYLPQNPTLISTPASPTTLTPGSAGVGTGVTLTASAIAGINNDTGFQTTDVGRLIRIQQGSVWGWCKITARTSTTVVTVQIYATLTSTAAKSVWRMGVWSATDGYPTWVVFHEDRLIFGGAAAKPQQLDGSNTSDYENFAPTDTAGVTTATNAIQFNLNSNDVNVLRWATSDEKGLCVGSLAAEWILKSGSQSDVLSATNPPIVKEATAYGSNKVQPLKIGRSTMFVQSTGRNIREMTYFFDVDGFRCPDLTQLSEHITGEGLLQLAFQKEPQILWAVREDGVLVSMTYERESDSFKVGWARHILGGLGDPYGNNATVESVAVIPEPNGTYDDVYLIVKRYIDGRYFRSIEFLTKTFDNRMEQKEAFFMDCGLSYDTRIDFNIFTGLAANPIQISNLVTPHGLSTGDQVLINEITGNNFQTLEGNIYTITVVTANTFSLDGTTYGDEATDLGTGTYNKVVSSISGYNHLEGEEVLVLADGYEVTGQTITGGKLTLDTPAAVVQVGFNYNSDGQLLRLDAGAADGTSIGKTRRTHRVGFLLERTLGLKIGMDFDHLDTINFRTAADQLSAAVPLYSGILSKTINATYDFENQIAWRQDGPFPGMILAVLPQMVTQDR